MHPVERAFHYKLPVWYQGKKDKVLGLGNKVCILRSQGCLTWIPFEEVSIEAPKLDASLAWVSWYRHEDTIDGD